MTSGVLLSLTRGRELIGVDWVRSLVFLKRYRYFTEGQTKDHGRAYMELKKMAKFVMGHHCLMVFAIDH